MKGMEYLRNYHVVFKELTKILVNSYHS